VDRSLVDRPRTFFEPALKKSQHVDSAEDKEEIICAVGPSDTMLGLRVVADINREIIQDHWDNVGTWLLKSMSRGPAAMT
jgi:hypothetical protein